MNVHTPIFILRANLGICHLPSAAHIKKEKKKSKETLGETQAGGDFSISPAAKGAVLDTSKWPLLLKVRLYTQLPHSPHTSLKHLRGSFACSANFI